MSKYLVTGGCGFIGRHLCATLQQRGDDVVVLDDRPDAAQRLVPGRVELHPGSVTDQALVRALVSRVDGVFHLAAVASVERSKAEWVACHQVNLTGAINVFDGAARAGGVPVVYASSAAVYGHPPAGAASENGAIAPISPYGADKAACELHAAVASNLYSVPTIGLRLFNVYGPGQDPSSPYSGVISRFLASAMRRRPLTIYGDGRQTRDFIYVVDVVACMAQAMEQVRRNVRVINVCTGTSTTIRDLADLVQAVAGVTVPVEYLPGRDGDIRFSHGDRSLLDATLGPGPATPLRQGLLKTLEAERPV